MLRHSITTDDHGTPKGLAAHATIDALRPNQHPKTVRAWADGNDPGALIIIGPPGAGKTFTAHAAINRYLARFAAPHHANVESHDEDDWAGRFHFEPHGTHYRVANSSVAVIENMLKTRKPATPALLRRQLAEALTDRRGRLIVTMTVQAQLIPHWVAAFDSLITTTWGQDVAAQLRTRTIVRVDP